MTGYIYVMAQMDPRAKESMPGFGPLLAENPLVGQMCLGCHQAFKEGDYCTLIPFGPGSDPEERDKAKRGQFYNAVAVPGHWDCVLGEPV